MVWVFTYVLLLELVIEIDVLLGLELDTDHHSEEGVVDL